MSLFNRLFKANPNDNSNVSDLCEFTNSDAVTFDKDSGVIRNVKILGTKSNNNRVYPLSTLRGAISLYEGMKVNVNHGEVPGARRDLEDRIGVLRNVKVQEDGLFGDLHFNPKHRFADQLMWNAEFDPNNIGFSHDATCRHRREAGSMIIEEIQVVKCVDLVGQPATTVGLFESESKTMKRTILEIAKASQDKASGKHLLRLCEQDEVVGEVPIAEVPVEVPVEASADDAIRAAFKAAIIAVLDDASLDVSAMQKKISDLLKAQEKIEGGGEATATGEAAATGQATEAEGDAAKPDEKDKEEIKKLREHVEKLSRKDDVRALLARSGETVSADIFEALCELPNDKSRQAVLDKLGKGGAERPISKRPDSTGTSKFQEALNEGSASQVSDGKSFADSVTH